MKKISLLIIVSLTILTMTNCESDNEIENYSEYLTVDMKSVSGTIEDPFYEIKIINSENKVFEKECKLIYSLTNKSTGDYYMAEVRIENKKKPSDPSLGYLNLQGGGHFTVVTDLNELDWQSNTLDNLLNGEYDFRVSLIIDDSVSPYNKIHSNELTFRKE